MHLILLESVEGVGRPGDQVKVKPGFARNYLLPQRKAMPLTEDSLRMLGKLKAKADAEERALISSMEEMSRKIAGLKLSIEARATEEGHLFGSVSDKDVLQVLKAGGWEVGSRAVRLSSHIKDAGQHPITLHLHADITAEITLEVLPIDADGNRFEPVAHATGAGDDDLEPGDDDADEGGRGESAAPAGKAAAAAEA